MVHELALADLEGLVLLNASDGDSTASISPLPPDTDVDTGGEYKVQARRLDGFTWPERFAYIKIDVEGAEQLVLSGSEQLLLRMPPMVWSFEYLDTQQRLGSCKAKLIQAFAR
jgi:FkbM family methyltransferase